MSTYAVSDLHGQFQTFEAGLEKIGFGDHDRLYVVGDAIDRGPEGVRILRYIMEHDNMDLIIGNHEHLMLNSVDPEGKMECNGPDSVLWTLYNGGDRTLVEWGALSADMRCALFEWLIDRYVIKLIDVGDRGFCLTHSYYCEGFEDHRYHELDYDEVGDIVWTSFFREDSGTKGEFIYDRYDRTFVTGHVPVIKVMHGFYHDRTFNELRSLRKDNLIDIDGGCAIGYNELINNGAIFLRLDDMTEFPVPLVKY